MPLPYIVSAQTVPMNDLRRGFELDGLALRAALDGAAASGWYVQGPEHDAFEREFATFCGVRHAIGVSNGTDAIEHR